MAKPIGILKATPEDFVVQELHRDPATPVTLCMQRSRVKGHNGGNVTTFALTKRGWTTKDAVHQIARQLDVPLDCISAYGLKDKHAITSQIVGVEGNFIPFFFHEDMRLVQIGETDRPLRNGAHVGNRFVIRIISDAPSIDEDALRRVPNLFGKQRMGDPGNEVVGKLILEGDYDAAGEMLQQQPEGHVLKRVRESARSWKDALLCTEVRFSFGFAIQKWQSHLWNTLLVERMGGYVPERLPLWHTDSDIRSLYTHLWNPKHIDEEALRVVRRSFRPSFINVTRLGVMQDGDAWRFTFDLAPGAYATVVLEQVFDLKENRKGRE